MRKSIMFSLAALTTIFIGCGGGSGDSTTTGYLVDSAISGVSYSCGEKSGITSAQGMFSCKTLPVTFSIGKIQLGTISTLPSDGKVYPQDLAGVERADFDNAKVKKLAQLFQSLDSDHDSSNGISIDATIAAKLDAEISDWNSINMEEYLYNTDANIQVVSMENAIKHLKDQFVQTPSNGGGDDNGGSNGENLIDTVDAKHIAGYTLKIDDPNDTITFYKTRYFIFKDGGSVTIVNDLDSGEQTVEIGKYYIDDKVKGLYAIYADIEGEDGADKRYILYLTDDYHIKIINPSQNYTILPNDTNGVVIKNNKTEPKTGSDVITVNSIDDLKGYTITSNENVSGTVQIHQIIEFKINCDGSYKKTIDTFLAGGEHSIDVQEGSSEDISIDSDSVHIYDDWIYLDPNKQIIAGESCIDADGKFGAECRNGLYVKTIKKDSCN